MYGEELERSPGVVYSLCEDVRALPQDGLALFLEDTWKRSYPNRAIWVLDAEYLEWVTPPQGASAIFATSPAGELLGCEFIVDRQIDVGSIQLKAAYAIMLTVKPEARRLGIAQGMLKHLSSAAARRDAQAILSVYDSGANGLATVQKYLRTEATTWSMHLSKPYRVWGATPDLVNADRYEPFKGAARLALAPLLRTVLEAKRATERPTQPPPTEVSAACPPSSAGLGVRVLPSSSLQEMYAPSERVGAGCFSTADGALAYHIPKISKTGLPVERMCQVQFIHCEGRGGAVARILGDFNRWMFSRGIICNFVLNSQALPAHALLAAKYLPTDRHIRFALRGPKDLMDSLIGLHKPWAVDVI